MKGKVPARGLIQGIIATFSVRIPTVPLNFSPIALGSLGWLERLGKAPLSFNCDRQQGAADLPRFFFFFLAAATAVHTAKLQTATQHHRLTLPADALGFVSYPCERSGGLLNSNLIPMLISPIEIQVCRRS
jgi:hypothetical protein